MAGRKRDRSEVKRICYILEEIEVQRYGINDEFWGLQRAKDYFNQKI